MKVYKLYIKMIKANKSTILLSICIFVLMTALIKSTTSSSFDKSEVKVNVLIDNQAQGPYSKLLEDYIVNNSDASTKEEYGADLTDAIFFREVDYIVVIPNDFDEQIQLDKVNLETSQLVQDLRTVVFSQKVESYISILHRSLEIDPNIDLNDLKEEVSTLANHQVEGVIVGGEKLNTSKLPIAAISFSIYPSLLVLVGVISSVVSSMFSEVSRKRLFASPLKTKELLIGTALGSFILCIVMNVIQLIVLQLVGYAIFDKSNILIITNIFLCSLANTAMSLAIGIAISGKGKSISTIITNIVSLGSSFLTGVFISQELLPTYVLSISRFFPSFWGVKGTNTIASSHGVLTQEIMQIFLIHGLYVVAFLVLCTLLFKSFVKTEG